MAERENVGSRAGQIRGQNVGRAIAMASSGLFLGVALTGAALTMVPSAWAQAEPSNKWQVGTVGNKTTEQSGIESTVEKMRGESGTDTSESTVSTPAAPSSIGSDADSGSDAELSEPNDISLLSTDTAVDETGSNELGDTQDAFAQQVNDLPSGTPASELNSDEALEQKTELKSADTAPVDLTGKSVSDNKISLLPSLSAVPQVDTDPAVSESLERQFRQILTLEENEDAFSPRLEEAYLSYGQSLAQVGQLDDARDMFARALHLARVNHGLYSLEQRPVLRAMFEMHFARGEIEEAEQTLQQVVWLEKKNPEDRDPYSYDMVVRLGNMFISEYIASPRITDQNLDRVNKGIRYLRYTVNRYGHLPLDTMMMPYGELALLYVIKSKIARELDRKFYENQRHRSFADYDRSPTVPSRKNFLSNAVEQLQAYYDKAVEEKRVDHQVRALRDIGDLYMLFYSSQTAGEYYRRAWSLATQLNPNHELVQSFEQPSYIPDFNYAGQRDDIDFGERFVKVPLSFSLSRLGRVDRIYTENGEGPYPTLVNRAKRASKKLQFRPPIDNGDMISTENFNFDVSVALRFSETVPGSEVSDGE